jgi:glutathione S-transferase
MGFTQNDAGLRYVLNFKRIPYNTTWLELPQIAPTMRHIGILPSGMNTDGSPFYSLPVIIDPSRRTPTGGPMMVSESWAIANYLDSTYPSPGPLFPEGTKPMQKLFNEHFYQTAICPLMPVLLPHIHGHLAEETRHAIVDTKLLSPDWEAHLGARLEFLFPKGTLEWEAAWANSQNGLRPMVSRWHVDLDLPFYSGFTNLAALLDENGSDASTLVMGKRVTFADFMVAAFLECIFLIHPDEWAARVRTWDGGRWEKLRDLLAPWRTVH